MQLFDVYPLNDIEITKAAGSNVWDANNQKYLDLYGGHAVISIGHTNPHYVNRLTDQLNKVGFLMVYMSAILLSHTCAESYKSRSMNVSAIKKQLATLSSVCFRWINLLLAESTAAGCLISCA